MLHPKTRNTIKSALWRALGPKGRVGGTKSYIFLDRARQDLSIGIYIDGSRMSLRGTRARLVKFSFGTNVINFAESWKLNYFVQNLNFSQIFLKKELSVSFSPE